MIDVQLIESARQIRKKYIDIVKEINFHEEDLKKLATFLEKKMIEFKRIHDEEFKNKPTKEEVDRITKLIVSEIEDMEIKEGRIKIRFEHLNTELEGLKVEEDILYKSIKDRYPNLSNEEIKLEIHKYLGE
jgi:chromosome segregation ATPase